jgi:5-methylcytosine-specific restriction endonuclease McrA
VSDPYADNYYRQTRPLVLAAAGGRCQIQAPGCSGTATTVDHIVPLVMGGSHHPTNLRAACYHCNSGAGRRIGMAHSAIGHRSRHW